MKTLVAMAGLLVGAPLGVALLMLNPVALMQPRPVALAGAVHTLGWSGGDGFRGFELTPRGLLGASGGRGPAREFAEPGIRHARVEAVLLPGDGSLPPALGLRLSAVAGDNSLLKASLGVAAHWNIVWPGRGSILLAGSENYWAPLRDGLWSAVRGRGFQPAAVRYLLPPMPGAEAPALVAGTGAFAGVRGAFREELAPVAGQGADFAGSRQLQLVLE
jgi:hypothetical protein